MITFEHISHRYETDEGETVVYKDFNEQIADGEFIVLTGRSGSGKTTLLKMILKEIEPDEGIIRIDDKSIRDIRRRDIPFYRRNIGVLFQDFKLIPDVNVYDNLYYAILATGGSGKDAEKKITHVLTMLGIDRFHKRFPREMSGGEQQKVCLARAVINHPKILLVDEPTGNLGPLDSADMVRLLDIIHAQGITVIMATHDISVADSPERRRINLDEVNPESEMTTPEKAASESDDNVEVNIT
ncbi:MAG: ATP-binding cassette domain-containing protein [Lachnospiraceae bacterium]|nr:ATP-binding cassette domain-containing protein [Lachnospiraceae bacterium]